MENQGCYLVFGSKEGVFLETLLITLFLSFYAINAQNQPVDYVDPQIGSVHERWIFYTPAALPFGMAKLAPHTYVYNSKSCQQTP